jgi:hypothetical protein
MTTRPLINGLTAGAVGTAVLNTVTYLDMVIRDRPSSNVPAQTAERATDLVGVTLAADEDEGDDDSQPEGQNRKQGVGALMGYLAGYGVAAAYGALRPTVLAGVPRSVAGVGIAAAATAATVLPYSALGVSDPRTWPAKSWAADIIPHLCYGWATAAAFDALQGAGQGD